MNEEKNSLDINYLKKVLPNYFGEMDESLFSEISSNMEWLRIERGEILFHTGDPGNSMYILFSGRLQAYSGGNGAPKKVLGYILHGESVGEMALLTGESRSATVRAMRSSILVKIANDAFRKLVYKNPELLFNVSKDLIFRLRKSNRAQGENYKPNNILFVQTSEGIGINSFLEKFSSQLKKYASSRIVSPQSVKGDVADYSDAELRGVLKTLNKVEQKYDHVLFNCPYGNINWLKMTGLIADKVYLLVDYSRGPGVKNFEQEVLDYIDRDFTNVEIVFCHSGGGAPKDAGTFIKNRNNLNHHHIRLNEEKDFGRLARILSGNAVALVLGGGGARGYAHLGVIKALNEHSIPVDLVGGTSVGSSIAASLALGWDEKAQYESALHFNRQRPFIDPTIPIFSFAAGKKMDRTMQDIFGEADIEDAWLGYFAVASNLTKTKEELIRSGKFWKACRSSMSLPAVLPPTVKDQDIMVDGGIFNNVPIDVMKRLYNCKVIAVNVGMQSDYSIPAERFPTAYEFIAAKLKRKNMDRFPGFFSIILRLTTIASSSKLEKDIPLANAVLNPPVSGFTMLDLNKIDDIVKAGYEYALMQMEEIKKGLEK